jgi:hypothetical protein
MEGGTSIQTQRRMGGFMETAVEMGSLAMIYKTNRVVSVGKNLIRKYTDTLTGRRSHQPILVKYADKAAIKYCPQAL